MVSTSTRQKLEQGRAAAAFRCATEGYSFHKTEYAPAVKKVPMMVKTNGLGATLAFMFSKQKTMGTVLKQIESWVNDTENMKTKAIYEATKGNNLVQKVTELNSSEYRILTIEVLAFLTWLRRFAEGIAKENEPKNQKD
ncbi:MAG: type III-B CRISPR module-associated protein Cmr5 [Saprospiraceae bacterium]|nr:type III-B CRISPR module-associated protein Cmr5 [Saprospiraceae bacterium]